MEPSPANLQPAPVLALIDPPARGADVLFGRPLLERIVKVCERAGVSRFYVKCPTDQRAGLLPILGRFAEDPRIRLVESFDTLRKTDDWRDTGLCVQLKGNIVFSPSQLCALLAPQAASGSKTLKLCSGGGDSQAWLCVGPMGDVLSAIESEGKAPSEPALVSADSHIVGLPYALDGHPSDRKEAERAIARALRYDTASSDGLLARLLDRKVSWRISYLLGHTAITPNQVTIANTGLGLIAAWLFAQVGYWPGLTAAFLFLISITIDGVDGELARLTMSESDVGRRLDAITDNIVHVAIFVGIAVGCYRTSNDHLYVYVLLALLGGFGLCAISVNRALSIGRAGAENFIKSVDRLTGRDFAYLLLLLALINRLDYFIIGAAIGTYAFAGALWWLTTRRVSTVGPIDRPVEGP